MKWYREDQEMKMRYGVLLKGFSRKYHSYEKTIEGFELLIAHYDKFLN